MICVKSATNIAFLYLNNAIPHYSTKKLVRYIRFDTDLMRNLYLQQRIIR